LSHHLKILIEAGLLNRKKEGTATYYRRALPGGALAPLHEEILLNIDAEPLSKPLAQGVIRIQKQREDNSLAFFKGHLARFREQQELIAPWKDYSEVALHLLERAGRFPPPQVIEVGVGEGWLLPELHERARHVIALDLSSEMLEQARRFAGHLDNIDFVCGSTSALVDAGRSAEVVIANMVLHHTSKPQHIIREAATLLTPGGGLIVSELCAHDQAWAREHCGDLWLGFSPEQLEGWARDAGLELDASVFLAQRNGFQIQVQHFRRT
jgi:ArsR family transcriptional regulator